MPEQLGPEPGWLVERARSLTGRTVHGPLRVLDDTTEFMSIDRDDVVLLGGEAFLVTGTEREKRFGLRDEPKFWVKRAVSLTHGSRHVLKMVFQESFRAEVGDHTFRCVRSAEKEARVLELVRDDGRFMRGRAVADRRGNLVRVLDFIRGVDLLTHLSALGPDHERYYRAELPGILVQVIDAFRAVERLHGAGLTHGDIRSDHLLLDAETGTMRWIDFDLDPGSPTFDVWSLGNILHGVVGRGIVRIVEVLRQRPDLVDDLGPADASVFFPYRLMNLGRLYPYLAPRLCDVLRRFAVAPCVRYDRVGQVVDDLAAWAAAEGWGCVTTHDDGCLVR